MKKEQKLTLLVMQGDKENQKSDMPVTRQAYHIIDVFMHYLPKINLDGSSKLTIYFTPTPDSEQQYMKNDWFNVSWYYTDKTCISKRDMRKMNQEDINEYYLGVIVNTLKHIAQINNRDLELYDIIDETAQKVRESNYEMTKKIRALSKSSPDRQYRANGYRHVNYQGEMYYVEILDKSKNILRYDLMEKRSYAHVGDLYKKATWEGGKYIVSNWLNKVVATIDTETNTILLASAPGRAPE